MAPVSITTVHLNVSAYDSIYCPFYLILVIPWAVECWAGYKIRVFYEEQLLKHVNTEHALCVMNHSGDLDWMIGWCIIDRLGMLGVSI